MSLKDIADEFGQELKAFNLAQSLLITGSVARGWEDEHSDIDLFCICKEFPDPDRLKGFYSDIGAQFQKEHFLTEDKIEKVDNIVSKPDQYLLHSLSYEGCDIDVLKFRLQDDINRHIQDVLEYRKKVQDMVYILKKICEGTVIFDKDGNISNWRDKLAPIPSELKEKLLSKEIDEINDFLKVYETELQRENKFFLDWKLSESIVSLYKIILILNNRYPRSWKWLTKEVMGLKYKPNNLEDEVEWIINQDNSLGGYENKLGKLRGLIEEMVDKAEGDVNIKSLEDIRI